MALFDKLSDFAKNVGDKTSEALETNRLSSKINVEKSAIERDMQKIGQYYYAKHQRGECLDDDVLEYCTAVDNHYHVIDELQDEIDRIKGEKITPAPVAAAPDEKEQVLCPSCHAFNAPGTKFCGECGAKLEPVQKVEPVKEAEPQEMLCPSCQAVVPPNTGFCRECGAKVREE